VLSRPPTTQTHFTPSLNAKHMHEMEANAKRLDATYMREIQVLKDTSKALQLDLSKKGQGEETRSSFAYARLQLGANGGNVARHLQGCVNQSSSGYSSTCASVKSFCNDDATVQKNCPKTCGTCKSSECGSMVVVVALKIIVARSSTSGCTSRVVS